MKDLVLRANILFLFLPLIKQLEGPIVNAQIGFVPEQ